MEPQSQLPSQLNRHNLNPCLRRPFSKFRCR
jgi:hypothetical protein